MAYKYRPKTKEELIKAIKKKIYEVQGTKDNPNWQADLNCIDTSLIIDMSYLFAEEYGLNKFNGDISNWNVSNIENIEWMFAYSQFNGDISNWNVSNVENMSYMFYYSKFNQNISDWDVSNVEDMRNMFSDSQFNQDISKWNISNVKYIDWMFQNSKFNGDIGSWPLKENTGLENISVSLEYSKLPDKIIYPETVANIFVCSVKNPNNTFNTENFKKIFKGFLNNRKEIYKNKGYKPDIVNKLVLNDITEILKHLKDKYIQKRFMEIMIEKDKKEINFDIKN